MSDSRFTAVILALIFSIAVNYTVYSQAHADSTKTSGWVDENDSIDVFYYQGSLLNLKLDSLTHIDTTITQVHQYDRVFRGNNSFSTLSNVGFAHTNLSFSPFVLSGFSNSWPYYRRYLFTNKKIKYYKLSKPYTGLFYVMGPKKEQEFQVIFSRNLYKGVTFGMNLNLVSSRGSYKRSRSNNNNGYVTLGYITPARRYAVNVNYMFNKMIMQENGGIADDSYFSDNRETDRSVIPVNLANAENTLKETSVFVEQFFNLSKPVPKNDTVNRLDLGSIFYSWHYKKDYYLFTDNDPLASFYDTLLVPLDSMQTYDSTGLRFVTNKIGWTSVGYQENMDEKPFYVYANLAHDLITRRLPFDTVETTWNQMNVSGGIGINIKESFYLKGTGYLYFGGYNSGDFGVKGTVNQYIGNINRNLGEMVLSMEIISKTPWWFYNSSNSNHFRWSNNLNKETYLILTGTYSFKNINAGVNFTTVKNFTYLNDSIKPEQLDKAGTVMKIFLQGNIPIAKFGINTKLMYQTTSRPNIIRIPTFHGAMNLYFRSPVFKRAATLQTGFQLRYFTAYYANAYMPELRAFYLQNDVQIGNYLWADYYITLKVKRARLFLKIANVTGYFEGNNYWVAPHYPDRDARFYFGVSWRFYD